MRQITEREKGGLYILVSLLIFTLKRYILLSQYSIGVGFFGGISLSIAQFYILYIGIKKIASSNKNSVDSKSSRLISTSIILLILSLPLLFLSLSLFLGSRNDHWDVGLYFVFFGIPMGLIGLILLLISISKFSKYRALKKAEISHVES